MPNVFMKFLKICTLGGTLAIGAPGAQAQQASGPYIAARQAAMAHDYGFASEYFARALVQTPQDPTLIAQTMSAFLAAGDVAKAQNLARVLSTFLSKSSFGWNFTTSAIVSGSRLWRRLDAA